MATFPFPSLRARSNLRAGRNASLRCIEYTASITMVNTVTMRSEHREIERMVEQLDEHRLMRDCATILQSFDQLVEPMALFRSHSCKEEAILYTFMDKSLQSRRREGTFVAFPGL